MISQNTKYQIYLDHLRDELTPNEVMNLESIIELQKINFLIL